MAFIPFLDRTLKAVLIKIWLIPGWFDPEFGAHHEVPFLKNVTKMMSASVITAIRIAFLCSLVIKSLPPRHKERILGNRLCESLVSLRLCGCLDFG